MLRPKFDCEYPCETCKDGNSKSCATCWTNFDDPQYLMTFTPKPDDVIQFTPYSECKSYCDRGFTTNGSSNKQCTNCDVSCASCSENGLVGDVDKCIDCADDHPFRLSMTQTCLKSCSMGLYKSTEFSCSQCRDPCQGC